MKDYVCEVCGETNEKGWTDKEADQEYKQMWPDSYQNQVKTAIVCDDCFKKGLRRWS